MIAFTCRLAAGLALLGGCGVLSGVDRYDVVDCVGDACTDGGQKEGAGDGAPADPARDAAADRVDLACAPGQVQLTVTIDAGANARIQFGGIDVGPGESADTCVRVGSNVRLETNSNVTWSGVDCKDGPRGDRCEFDVPSSDFSITVSS
jgi:hypothetical protein